MCIQKGVNLKRLHFHEPRAKILSSLAGLAQLLVLNIKKINTENTVKIMKVPASKQQLWQYRKGQGSCGG